MFLKVHLVTRRGNELLLLVRKAEPEDVVSVDGEWLETSQEDDVTDIEFDRSTQLLAMKQDRIRDVLASDLERERKSLEPKSR